MMGERRVGQEALFYEFSLERHVPSEHLLRSIDRFVDLSGVRCDLAPFYSEMGRPSIDPELMIRMLIVGYCFAIRSERRLFETVLQRCIDEGLVGGEGFAVDASLIRADVSERTRVGGAAGLPPDATGRAVEEYLAVLDDAAFGAATEVAPKFIAPADPAARWIAAHRGPAFFAYSVNYLIDTDNAIIVDVEATTAIRQAEVLAARRMVERSLDGFDLCPQKLIGDTAYGAAEMLNWLVDERGIEPHIPVWDKSQRTDGTFSRDDFTYDHTSDTYRCPAGKTLQRYRRRFAVPRSGVMKDNSLRYRASKRDCEACPLKPRCCPNTPARKVPRSIHEGARDLAREIAKTEPYETSRRQRKKVEMLFAHLKRILRTCPQSNARL